MPGEQPAHAAVTQQVHVLDAVRPGDHPRDQRGHLRPGVRALVRRHRQLLLGQRSQTRPLRQPQHRNQPAGRHETRLVETRGQRR